MNKKLRKGNYQMTYSKWLRETGSEASPEAYMLWKEEEEILDQKDEIDNEVDSGFWTHW